MEEQKHEVEIVATTEVFQEDKVKDSYYISLRDQGHHTMNRDQQISRIFSNDCINGQQVPDMPFFSKIRDKKLALISYKLNPGLCKAASKFFIECNWRLSASCQIQELHLEDNNISDVDFANILKGLKDQRSLKSLIYSRNQFGEASVEELSKLIGI